MSPAQRKAQRGHCPPQGQHHHTTAHHPPGPARPSPVSTALCWPPDKCALTYVHDLHNNSATDSGFICLLWNLPWRGLHQPHQRGKHSKHSEMPPPLPRGPQRTPRPQKEPPHQGRLSQPEAKNRQRWAPAGTADAVGVWGSGLGVGRWLWCSGSGLLGACADEISIPGFTLKTPGQRLEAEQVRAWEDAADANPRAGLAAEKEAEEGTKVGSACRGWQLGQGTGLAR